MKQIQLTPEQAAILFAAQGPVAVCSPDGAVLGFVSPKARLFAPDKCPFTPEEIEAAIRDAETCKQWFTTEEVLRHLRAQEQS
jgi:hypothetical protein